MRGKKSAMRRDVAAQAEIADDLKIERKVGDNLSCFRQFYRDRVKNNCNNFLESLGEKEARQNF